MPYTHHVAGVGQFSRIAAAAISALLCGCPVSTPAIDELAFSCTTDADCLQSAGYRCDTMAGVCVKRNTTPGDAGETGDSSSDLQDAASHDHLSSGDSSAREDASPTDQLPGDSTAEDVSFDTASPPDGSVEDCSEDAATADSAEDGGAQPEDAAADDGAVEDALVEDSWVNLPPEAASFRIHCQENRPCDFVLQATDPDSRPSPLTPQVTDAPAHGPLATFVGLNGQYQPAADFCGHDEFQYTVSDGADFSQAARVYIAVVCHRSCASILVSDGRVGDGVYYIDPDGTGPESHFDAYCDMTTDGGGWSLALKADGRNATFIYESPLWYDASVLNPESTDLSATEAKLASFNVARADEVSLAMRDVDAVSGPWSHVAFPWLGYSLQSSFLFGSYLPTRLGRDAWMGLVADPALQSYCNAEGFNVDWTGATHHARVRVGLIGNNELDCNTADSRIGIGGGGTVCGDDPPTAVGNVSCHFSSPGDRGTPTFGALFVRSHDFSAMNARRSCQAHLLSGAGISGFYRVDPAGSGAPFSVFCDMTTDGGGWALLASYSGADGEEPLVSDVERLDGNPLLFLHSNLGRAKKIALCADATESLLAREDGTYLVVDAPLFDASLATPDTHSEQAVWIRSSDGTEATGFKAWANHGIIGGGDFGITPTPYTFDHHAPDHYYNLNAGCAHHLIYSYSAGAWEGDAGYDVSAALGDWTATHACNPAEGGLLRFYAGVR